MSPLQDWVALCSLSSQVTPASAAPTPSFLLTLPKARPVPASFLLPSCSGAHILSWALRGGKPSLLAFSNSGVQSLGNTSPKTACWGQAGAQGWAQSAWAEPIRPLCRKEPFPVSWSQCRMLSAEFQMGFHLACIC